MKLVANWKDILKKAASVWFWGASIALQVLGVADSYFFVLQGVLPPAYFFAGGMVLGTFGIIARIVKQPSLTGVQ